MARLSNKDAIARFDEFNFGATGKEALAAFKELIDEVRTTKKNILVIGFGSFKYNKGSMSRHPSVGFSLTGSISRNPDDHKGGMFDEYLSKVDLTTNKKLFRRRLGALFAIICLDVAYRNDAPLAITNYGRFSIREMIVSGNVGSLQVSKPGLRFSPRYRLPLKNKDGE